MKIKVAITGGIGSGKSTVSKFIKELGYDVYSCDEIYADLIFDKGYVEKISRVFPEAIVNGEISKKILSEIIFSNKNERNKLNKIAHPLIIEKLLWLMNSNSSELVFAEVPLLFEGNFEELFDKIIVVVRSEEDRIKSVVIRDKISEQDIRKKISSQIDYAGNEIQQKLKKKNIIILDNNGEVETLRKKTIKAIRQI